MREIFNFLNFGKKEKLNIEVSKNFNLISRGSHGGGIQMSTTPADKYNRKIC